MEHLDIEEVESVGVKSFSSVHGPKVSWKAENRIIGHSLNGTSMMIYVRSDSVWGMSSYPQQIYLRMNRDEWRIAQIVKYENVEDDDGERYSKITARYDGR